MTEPEFPEIEPPEQPEPVGHPDIVIEQEMAGYRLPDGAIDLETWLRTGLDVYNFLVLAKPVLFQLLESVGGEFRASLVKANEDRLRTRIVLGEEAAGEDRVIVARFIRLDEGADDAGRT